MWLLLADIKKIGGFVSILVSVLSLLLLLSCGEIPYEEKTLASKDPTQQVPPFIEVPTEKNKPKKEEEQRKEKPPTIEAPESKDESKKIEDPVKKDKPEKKEPPVSKNPEKEEKDKPEESYEISDGWPRMRVLVNSITHRFENTPEDLAAGWTVHDIYNLKNNPVLRDGFVFTHGTVTNLEDEPVEILLSNPAVWIKLDTERLIRSPGETCQLKHSYHSKQSFPQNHAKGERFLKVYDYKPNGDVVNNEIQLPKTKLKWFTVKPKQTILIKYYYRMVLDNNAVSLLRNGYLPTHKSCEARKNKWFYKNCAQEIDKSFLNICTNKGKELHALTGMRVIVPKVSFLVQHPGNKNPENRVSFGTKIGFEKSSRTVGIN